MRISIPLIALALSACGPLVQIGSNEAPPPALLRLTALPDPQGATSRAAGILRITLPHVPGELRNQRIPVERDATNLQFLEHGQWVEPPAPQLQRLLLSRIAARTGLLTVDERSADIATTQRLSGRLTAFGLDVTTGQPRAHLRYEALLTQSDGTAQSALFDIHVPVREQSARATAAALNQASNQLADALSAWVTGGPPPATEQGAAGNH